MATTQTFKTHNSLPSEVREQMVEVLNSSLADTLDLYTQVKQAHWNVKGPNFYQFHQLFDDLAAEIFPFIDEIAERATALGGLANGTARMAAKSSRLEEYPLTAIDGMEHIRCLADRYATYTTALRTSIDLADEAGDLDTSDLFTEVSRIADKQLWFIEAHLQG